MEGLKQGFFVELLSIGWMAIEAGVGIAAGVEAHSLALVAFGADSVIELIAGLVLLWRLRMEMSGAHKERVEWAEKTASWVVGIALLLLALYIVISVLYDLWLRRGAETSPWGIALAVVASILMPWIARAKMRIGQQIGSPALRADGACSFVCGYMAWTLLLGLLLTALFAWWWADPLASLALVYFVVREGLEALDEARGEEDNGCCRK